MQCLEQCHGYANTISCKHSKEPDRVTELHLLKPVLFLQFLAIAISLQTLCFRLVSVLTSLDDFHSTYQGWTRWTVNKGLFAQSAMPKFCSLTPRTDDVLLDTFVCKEPPGFWFVRLMQCFQSQSQCSYILKSFLQLNAFFFKLLFATFSTVKLVRKFIWNKYFTQIGTTIN